jgi:hypothetical protein
MQELLDNIGNVQTFLGAASDLVQLWYRGGFVLGIALALVAVVWIFYDASRKGREATIWKVISVVSVVLAIPSVVLWLYPSLADPAATTSIYGAVDALAYLGIVAGLGGLVSIVCYAMRIGEPAVVCPTCGRELDPSWDYCPYCVVPETPTVAESVPEPEPIASTETLTRDTGLDYAPSVPAETRVLRPKEIAALAYLVQTSGMRKGTTYQLGEITNVGRDATDNEIVIDDDAVSRRHARIKLEEGQFVLYDLASANGTFLNGEKIVKHPLAEDDSIKMGETKFSFVEVKEKNQD